MNQKILNPLCALCAVTAILGHSTAFSDEPGLELATESEPSRWHVSGGVRLSPGIKTKAAVSSRGVVDAAGRMNGSNRSSGNGRFRADAASSTSRDSSTSSRETTEPLVVTPTSRLDFDNGFIDMVDDAGIAGETANWHFDDAGVFDEANGSITISGASATTTSRESSISSAMGPEERAESVRTAFAETFAADVSSSHESDAWGGDIEIGYDLYQSGRFSIGLGLGTTLYRNDNAIKAAGRCYSASRATTARSTSGRIVETTTTTTETTETSTETTTIVDDNLAYPGASDDLRNDDGSIGAGTADGRTNPYGGYNPVLTIADGRATRTTRVDTLRDVVTETSRSFDSPEGVRTSHAVDHRTIDVVADGDVEMQEVRLGVQPSWKVAEWLDFRGMFGAVATHVSVDTDAAVLVNGIRTATISGDDEDWGFSGLCGIDCVFRPYKRLEIAVGGDLRLGDATMDYTAGVVHGTVELARYTFRAGIGIAF